MHNVFKKIAVTVLSLGIVLSVFSSCSDDIILEPLDSLLGEYSGHYTLTDLSQGGSGRTLINIDIRWVFRDIAYELDDSTATICSPSGEYTLNGDQITLKEGFDGNSGGVCDPSLNPLGDFSLRRPDDSLILTQNENNFFKEIRLKNIQ